MGYFNFFDEWAMDPRVQSMPESFQRRHAMLLCLRNIGETANLSDYEVATFLHIKPSDAAKTKKVFKEKGFIDGDGWNVRQWDKRQNGSCESLERVRKHRAKKALHGVTGNATETLRVTEPPARADLLTNLLTNKVTKEPPNPRKRGKAAKPPSVPDWIPGDLWNEHRDVRRRKRGALTPRADRQIIEMLEAIRNAGHDPVEQLKRSCLKGWIEVFVPDSALRTENSNGKHATDPTPEQIARWNAAIPAHELEKDA